jgi:hypothetical protein
VTACTIIRADAGPILPNSVNKYLRHNGEPIMPQIIASDPLDARRDIIKLALDEIATKIGMVMREEGLHFPVRNSGDSLATIATTLDPSD